MATVGFVGLGIMGRPMIRNLLKAGHTVIAYGRNPKKLDACVADGAERGASNRDVGLRASIIFTMLPDGPQVEEVVLGEDGILAGCRPGSLIVDMSSINPLVSQRIASACADRSLVACNIAAMGEALVLATRCGLDPEIVLNAVKGGLAGSAVLNAKGPMLIARNFKPGFKIQLHQKDLRK